MQRMLATILLSCTLGATAQASSARPVVLELFTSQGCSSCPPADALLAELAKDPTLLALSFHVDYWDRLGWRDVFSSAANTERQRRYAQWLGSKNVFTPQLMVDGSASLNGSDRAAVASAIAIARPLATDVRVTGRRLAENALFSIAAAPDNISAHLIAVHYQPAASTTVERGENGGRTLHSVNNVTAISDLGAWQAEPKDYAVPQKAGEGVAMLLQRDRDGHILGAANLPAQ